MFIKNKNQSILLATNILLVFFLILLSNLHVLPLHFGDFAFFAILTLALALYRPGWSFLFFVGTIMLEQVNLAPLELGIAIRPYQFFGGLTILAIIIRALTNRLNFKLAKVAWYDFLIILIGVSSFVSIANSQIKDVSLKQSVILASFIFLYFLVRNFLQTAEDIKKVIPFFLSSSVIVMLYGIWQNVRFLHNLSNFEVMPGRPNATFTEADWLGIFLVLLLAVTYSLIYFFHNNDDETISNFKSKISNQIQITKNQILKTFLYIVLILDFISLILTVSRSAWLGALAVTFIFLFTIFTNLKLNFKEWQWRKTIAIKIPIVIAIILSIAIVYIFHLTNFQLFNRAQSTGSGLQKITISCQDDQQLPDAINDTSELEKFGCRHINLEEIEGEQLSGNIGKEIYRKDPNIGVRSEIYRKSWELIKAHPILGIGWGSISTYLGTDERGAGLNASNLFLEVWLATGILGLLALLVVWVLILLKAVQDFIFAKDAVKILPLFIILGWFALTVPNLFNSGILLGFIWLFLAVAAINNKK